MAITLAQFTMAMQRVEAVKAKQAAHDRYVESVQAYLAGGDLSNELQAVLRDWMRGQLPALLDQHTKSIQADIAAIKAIVTDFA